MACAMLLSGCQTNLLVHNATVDKVIPAFKDYVGIHGYLITYANDKTGSYHVDMGVVYVPSTSSTTKSTTVVSTPPSQDQPMTAYEDTTWRTVSSADHYVDATAAVSIIQQGSDVRISIDTNNAGGASLNDIQDYLTSLGYTVETK
jgi:hypothetical protein